MKTIVPCHIAVSHLYEPVRFLFLINLISSKTGFLVLALRYWQCMFLETAQQILH